MNGNKENASLRKRTGRQERTILILDYDGTLHDSMGIYEPAFRTAVSELEEKGWLEHRDYSAAEIRHWIGFSAGDMWKSFQPDFTSRQRETGSSRIGALMTEAIRAGRARLYPGTEETLEILAASYDLLLYGIPSADVRPGQMVCQIPVHRGLWLYRERGDPAAGG